MRIFDATTENSRTKILNTDNNISETKKLLSKFLKLRKRYTYICTVPFILLVAPKTLKLTPYATVLFANSKKNNHTICMQKPNTKKKHTISLVWMIIRQLSQTHQDSFLII